MIVLQTSADSKHLSCSLRLDFDRRQRPTRLVTSYTLMDWSKETVRRSTSGASSWIIDISFEPVTFCWESRHKSIVWQRTWRLRLFSKIRCFRTNLQKFIDLKRVLTGDLLEDHDWLQSSVAWGWICRLRWIMNVCCSATNLQTSIDFNHTLLGDEFADFD